MLSKSVGELAALIRAREVSSVEVVQAHLDRISDVNESANAITVVLEDAVLNAEAANASPRVGAFHGVPITVKEQAGLDAPDGWPLYLGRYEALTRNENPS